MLSSKRNHRSNYSSEPERARAYAFLLLKFRMRSEAELALRLKRKNFPQPIIAETMAFLKAKGFLDDRLFAQAWLTSRLKKPLGLRRLEEELKVKGVPAGIIRAEIEKVRSGYSEEKTVLQLVGHKLQQLKSREPQKVKQRLYAYLLRRGFSPGIVVEAIQRLTKS